MSAAAPITTGAVAKTRQPGTKSAAAAITTGAAAETRQPGPKQISTQNAQQSQQLLQ
jgi:hypothetical protein